MSHAHVTELTYHDEELACLALPRDTLRVTRGIGSGLSRRAGDADGVVWAVGDCGPNLKLPLAIERYGLHHLVAYTDKVGAKLMPCPTIGPAITELHVGHHRVTVHRTVSLRDITGRPLSGMPPAGTDARARSIKRTMGMKRLFFPISLALGTAGCGTVLPTRHLACNATPPKVPVEGDPNSATISVLTYNIEGLGWPARLARASRLADIGRHLAAARASGAAPDVVMVQEMFSGPAKKAVLATGYPAIASGPGRTAKLYDAVSGRLPGRASIKRGETGFHLTGSGLAIASVYPIIVSQSQPYGRRSCAGIDCLSNKGVMLARIVVPGVPTPIDLYNTHMNSRGASKAPHARNLAAHERQALAASRFIDKTHDDDLPVIFGGDFNMRRAQDRWDNFTRYQPMQLVHRICAHWASNCDVRMSWDGDKPWVDTQDLQFFQSGRNVTIRPIRVEAMFDGGTSGPALSDHDGLLVTYRISWPSGTRTRRGC